jgi:putative two-component system response regulator
MNLATTTDSKKATILIVDDDPVNLRVLSFVLEKDYRVRAVINGEQAIRALQVGPKPDIILLDIMMPGVDGYGVLMRIRELGMEKIPIIFVTALDDEVNEQHGLRLGAADYITKPISGPIVLARIKTQLDLKAANDHLEDLVEKRTKELQQANQELRHSYVETARSFSLLLENRDPALAGHSKRVAECARRIAQKIKLPGKEINDILFAGLLSRIGTLTLPRKILIKPIMGLSKEERNELMISAIGVNKIFNNIPPLRNAVYIIANQYERFDGSGFPNGLQGNNIPIGARIIAVARDFDLLIEGMLDFKKHMVSSAKDYFNKKKGAYYDPEIVDIHNDLVGQAPKVTKPLIEIGLVNLVEGMDVAEVKFGEKVFLRNQFATKELIRELQTIIKETGLYCSIKVRAR